VTRLISFFGTVPATTWMVTGMGCLVNGKCVAGAKLSRSSNLATFR